MPPFLTHVATIMVAVIALVVVAVGGAVVIAGNLSFQEYLDALWKVAAAAAGLGIGRGIMAGLKAEPK